MNIDSQNPDASLISYVAEQIAAGQVVSIPTDTFYCLAADPMNLRAVERIYDLKTRARHKALSLLIENLDQARDLALALPDVFYALAEKYWPGPLTMIVKAAFQLPLKATANTGNVALRLPASRIATEIVRRAGRPITGTAASIRGAGDCVTAEQVRAQLGNDLPLIVNGGPTPRDVPSSIVDLSGDFGPYRVVREGAIAAAELEEMLSRAG